MEIALLLTITLEKLVIKISMHKILQKTCRKIALNISNLVSNASIIDQYIKAAIGVNQKLT